MLPSPVLRDPDFCAPHRSVESDDFSQKYNLPNFHAQKRLFPLFRYAANVEWDDFLKLLAAQEE